MEINEIKTKEDIIKYVKSTDKKDIGQDLFNYLFGYIENKGPRFKVNQSITLKPGDIFNNKEPIKTCIGNYLINYLVFNENIFKHLGFINKRMDGDTLSEIDDKISYLLLNDYITTKDVIYYLDRLQFFGFSLTSLITTSLSPKVMFELPEVKKRKEELYKKYKKEIDNNDIVVMNKIEQELMDLAKSIIKDDPGYDLYKSGSKASFANNYKLMNISKGVMNDLQTGGYKVSMASYEEGVPKDQVDKFANGMVSAEYAKGVGTQQGGYMVKKYNAAFQAVTLDPDPNSDCGTEKTVDILVTKFNAKLLGTYRYIKQGNSKFLLTPENIKNFIGKTIHLYDPLYCKNEKICHKCAGDLYYKLDVLNAGTTVQKIGSTVLNKGLKKKHDNRIKLYHITNIEDDLVL